MSFPEGQLSLMLVLIWGWKQILSNDILDSRVLPALWQQLAKRSFPVSTWESLYHKCTQRPWRKKANGAAVGTCRCDEQPEVWPLMASDTDMTGCVWIRVQDMDLAVRFGGFQRWGCRLQPTEYPLPHTPFPVMWKKILVAAQRLVLSILGSCRSIAVQNGRMPGPPVDISDSL